MAASESAAASEAQVNTLETIEKTMDTFIRSQEATGAYLATLKFTRNVQVPAPRLADIVDEQNKMNRGTLKLKKEQVPQRAIDQKNLIHAVDAVVGSLDMLSHRMKVGTGMLWAATDMEEAAESLLARYGPHVAAVDLLPPGAPRRNWKQTLLSDGSIIVRHPSLDTALEMADRIGTDLQMYAG